MTIQLSTQAQAFVKSQLDTGKFADESEVVSRLLEYIQQEQIHWETQTRQKVKASIKSADAGKSTRISTSAEADAFAQQLLRHAKENRSQRQTDS